MSNQVIRKGKTQSEQTYIINANSVYIHSISEIIQGYIDKDADIESITHSLDLLSQLSHEVMINNALLIDGLREVNNEK